jgi:hypothetical protein
MILLRDDWENAEVWDAFVERHDQARFCQLFRYGTTVECYGYVPWNICFLKNAELVGILPASLVKSLLVGRKLVSQPFSEYGGLLLDPTLGDDEVAEIVDLLWAYLKSHREFNSIEMHGNHGVPARCREHGMLAVIPHHIGELPLNRSVDKLWREVVRYSVRKAVNQARNHGLEVSSECNNEIIQTKFFPLYLQSMKRLGVPPHKLNYYMGCYRFLGDKMIILWAKQGAKYVAGLLGFSCGKRLNIVNTVSDPAYWHMRPNDLLHWEFIKWAAENGFKYFDFGSIRYAGQLDFKKKWGCELIEHKYHVMARNKSDAVALNSSSQSMQTAAGLWSRYVPSSMAPLLGPMLRKHLAR